MQQQEVWGIRQPPSLPVEMLPVIILIYCSKIAFLLEEIIEEKEHWQKQEAQAVSANTDSVLKPPGFDLASLHRGTLTQHHILCC